MSTSYHHELRAHLSAGFNKLTQGLQDACQVDQVIQSLKDTFYDSMRDLIRVWSARNMISRLPAEVLAMIIGFLPLRSRIAATHVSHAWRVAALAVPAVWTDITIPAGELRSPKGIFRRILSRTGNLPIDFTADLTAGTRWLDDSLVPLLLVVHMHHVRSVRWPGTAPLRIFQYPAPMLEVLETWGEGLPDNFLGGRAGRLLTLRMGELVLPDTCPAVSTVTDLQFQLPDVDGTAERAPARLSQLFVLFPQLRCLTMTSMRASHAEVLCGLRPPRPLSALFLSTTEVICDIFTVFDAWQTERMEDVRLSMMLDTLDPQSFASYVSKARSLVVQVDKDLSGHWALEFDACSSDGLSRSVLLDTSNCRPVYYPSGAAAVYISCAQASLAQLRTLTTPPAIFAALSPDKPDEPDVSLPALEELTLDYCKHDTDNINIDCWPLGDLKTCVARLQTHPVPSLVVAMRTCDRYGTPSRDDVLVLLNELAAIAPRAKESTFPVCAPMMRIRVTGVPRNVVDELASRQQELGIDCDSGDLASETSAPS